ncbi:MAG: hypothetical protein WC291_07215 [Thermodesulfovibrionales bacterium]|jgi:hypothetical protein
MQPFNHKEHYAAAHRQMAIHAEGKATSGFLQFARDKFPQLYIRYAKALEQVHELWGKQDPESITAFKQAVQTEVEGTRYFIDKYQDEQISLMSAASSPVVTAPEDTVTSQVLGITVCWTEPKPFMEAFA